MRKAIICLCAMAVMSLTAAANEDNGSKTRDNSIAVEGYGETGIMKTQDGWSAIDPHIVAGAEYTWRDGWSAFGEVEYMDEVDITQFFIQKTFTEWATVRLGKMTVPFGISNIHDNPMNHFAVSLPAGEIEILPENCNLMGISFLGSRKTWNYEAQMLLQNGSLAVAVHIENSPDDNLSLGIGGYYDGKFIVSGNLNLSSDAFTGRAIATYSQTAKAVHCGAEAGYDLLHGLSKAGSRLFAFARYDFSNHEEDCHSVTVGLNYLPIKHIVVKAEYARNMLPASSENNFAIGVGISLP
ncbi:hypothetical protein HPS57_09255 [Prevotella sp. PINT]|uniref:hypothetical protein n=1 Tax=Palleniella intestinalis TaxID=2736291 RepID=UPI001555C587|nr:hypothetical protein [Palleniella intestinalis]NPD82155.1 hypothetical protein [Palleniella intestinalis]